MIKIEQVVLYFLIFCFFFAYSANAGFIVDHNSTDITKIPEEAINRAKTMLHIGYGHTSHGSQLAYGMTNLVDFANNGGLGLSLPTDIFKWNNGGTDGALDLEEGDGYGSGWLDHDCGYYPNWINETIEYLDDTSHTDVNVIIWSWCGEASDYTEQDMIDKYLSPMSQLERDYPNVMFVYMTGHSDGTGEEGNLHIRNQQIRQFCMDSNKVLYDFYDIECYDPDNNYYGDKAVLDDCSYDSNGDGTRDKNWATDWQDSHTQDVDWYDCYAAHSQPLNGNRKAYAAWWLWARLAGWEGDESLPVEMMNFTASPGDQMVTLKWETASEMDNMGYIVYRSISKETDYNEVDSYKYNNDLKGSGTTSNTTKYQFTDRQVVNGQNYWYKIADVDINGKKIFHGPISAVPMKLSIDKIDFNISQEWSLRQNYPNPFNPITNIIFNIPESANDGNKIELVIYNVLGKNIKTLYSGQIVAGYYKITWNGIDDKDNEVPSGIYLYQLKSNKLLLTKKMILTR